MLHQNKTFLKYDDYMTPAYVWEDIDEYIPKDKVIWECCMLNSKSNSMEYWKEMGYKVVGDNLGIVE